MRAGGVIGRRRVRRVPGCRPAPDRILRSHPPPHVPRWVADHGAAPPVPAPPSATITSTPADTADAGPTRAPTRGSKGPLSAAVPPGGTLRHRRRPPPAPPPSASPSGTRRHPSHPRHQALSPTGRAALPAAAATAASRAGGPPRRRLPCPARRCHRPRRALRRRATPSGPLPQTRRRGAPRRCRPAAGSAVRAGPPPAPSRAARVAGTAPRRGVGAARARSVVAGMIELQ